MKKYIFLVLIATFLFVTPSYAEQRVEDVFDQLVNEEMYFKSPQSIPHVEVIDKKDVEEKADKNAHMPLFKETRLKLLNLFNKHSDINEKQVLELEKKWAKEEAERAAEEERKQWAGHMYLDYDDEKEKFDAENSDKKSEENSEDGLDKKTIDSETFVGGVKQQVTQKEMILDCDEIKYNEETNDIEAIGNPYIDFPSRGITLKADLITYNRDSNILKATGNVVITKDGVPSFGEFIQINLNEETMFMDKFETNNSGMQIKAKNVESVNGALVFNYGRMDSENSNKYVFRSRIVGPDFSKMLIDEEDRSDLFGGELSNLKISSSSISVKSNNVRDIITAKDTEVSYNGKYLFTIPSVTAYTNKHRDYFEANYPEFGSRSMLGMFAGPGLVVPTPNGSTLKLIPMVNYKGGDLGFGGAAKFKSSFHDAFIMYGSVADKIVAKGKHELDDNLYFRYGMNSFQREWFLGYRMPKYSAELIYDKSYKKRDFLAEGKDLTYRHMISGGYVHDGEWNMRTEHLKSSNIGTMRFRYMAEIYQSLYKYEDKANRKSFEFGAVMQGSAALYGTGDTQLIGRVGPRIHTQYKNWMQDIAYFASAFQDNTPLTIFDTYRYGRSNIRIHEAIRLHKYLSLGWSGWITLSDDAPNGKMFQENRFVLSLGPDDFKVNFAYDIMRKTTYITFVAAFDTKKTQVEFDKLVLKNPENLGAPKKKKETVFTSSTQDAYTKKVKPALKYAEIINIEDPDKESI